MTINNNNYGAEQIETLDIMTHVRLRPGMYIGSNTIDGRHHVTLEVMSNSIDEYLNGYGSIITVFLEKDGFITIGDNGRGIPIGLHPSGKSVLQAVFDTANTGGKFNNSGEAGYNTSGGMNGIGAKATNATSERFEATTTRDGQRETVIFERGKLVHHELKKCDLNLTGTTVRFKPDSEVFVDGIDLDFNRLEKQVQELSFLCSGLEFVLIDLRGDKEVKKIFKYENGIMDYVKHLGEGKKALTDIFYCSSTEGRVGVEIGMQYNATYSDSFKLYTNNIPNSSGTHLTGFRTALTRAMNEFARDKKLLKEKDDNFTGEDLKEGLTFVLSLKMPDPVFSGQTKDVLNSPEGRGIVERLMAKEIRLWLDSNGQSGKAIIEKALLTRKAREAAKKAREATRKKAVGGFGAVLPGKLADCQSKDVEECEIYLVEGDSAAGTAKNARCRRTQAILPLRGKVLNVLKYDLAKAMGNAEIKAMITAFGLEVIDGKIVVNEDKLRYKKIVIMTDGDVDGSHIRILLLTFLWKFAKDLILKGYVYCAMPPLYKVTKGKDSEYLLDDNALLRYKAKYPNANLIVNRFKGLGEMSMEQLEETTMNKENRILKRIDVEDMAVVERVVQNLMGESVAPRKIFIEKNAHLANVDL